jgi:hypothetical protein
MVVNKVAVLPITHSTFVEIPALTVFVEGVSKQAEIVAALSHFEFLAVDALVYWYGFSQYTLLKIDNHLQPVVQIFSQRHHTWV